MRHAVIRQKLGKVDRAIEKAIEGSVMPGAVVLATLHRDGEWLEHAVVKGHAAVRPERIPMTRETVFDLASLTKVMATTTAVMLLVEDGVLDLEDPVAKHIQHFGERDKEHVTLRHLLTHSSGLKPWRDFAKVLRDRERKTLDEKWIATPQAREWIIESICRSGRVHEPGEAAVYGDLDFIALGAVVEAVSNESLDAFCAERVFKPLGLTNTAFRSLPVGGGRPDEAERRTIAATEDCPWRDRVIWGEVHDPNAYAMGGVAGHAGLFAPADDVMKFARAWLDAWHGREGAVLPQQRVREFSTRQKLPGNSDWALGWDTPTTGNSSSGSHFSEQSVGHLGFTGTSIWIDLEREALVVMLTNRIHVVAKRSKFSLRPEIHDLLIEAFTA